MPITDPFKQAPAGGIVDPFAARPTPQAAPRQPIAKKPEPSSMVRRVVGDTAVDVGKGVLGLGEAVVGAANLVTGGYAGKGLEAIGYDPATSKKMLEEGYSHERVAANQAVEEASGFIGTAKAMLENPSTIAGAVAESAPLMLGGGAVARGLGGVGRLAARPVARAAIGEGVVGAGSAAEQTRQQTDDGLLTAEQIGAALGSGAGTALIGAAGGTVARKLGIGDVDVALAGGNTAGTGKNFLRRGAEGMVAEGVLEEMPQSMQEQAWSNVALDRPLEEGVAEAGAAGLLTGAAMGGPFAAVAGPGEDKRRGNEIPINNEGLQPRTAARPKPAPVPAGPITQAASPEPMAVQPPAAQPFAGAAPGSLADAANAIPRTAARPAPRADDAGFRRTLDEQRAKAGAAVEPAAVDGEIAPITTRWQTPEGQARAPAPVEVEQFMRETMDAMGVTRTGSVNKTALFDEMRKSEALKGKELNEAFKTVWPQVKSELEAKLSAPRMDPQADQAAADPSEGSLADAVRAPESNTSAPPSPEAPEVAALAPAGAPAAAAPQSESMLRQEPGAEVSRPSAESEPAAGQEQASSPRKRLAEEFKAATGDDPEQAKVRRAGIAMRNLQRENGNLDGEPEADPYTPEQSALLDRHEAMKNPSSRYLFHTTTPDRLASITAKGLQPGSKQRYEGVSSTGKVSLAANEATASYYGKQGDVMLRLRKDYDPGDLATDALAGEGSYTTGKPIPPDALEMKQGKKWIPLTQLRGAKNLAAQADAATDDAFLQQQEGAMRQTLASKKPGDKVPTADESGQWTRQVDGRWSDGQRTVDDGYIARSYIAQEAPIEGSATRVDTKGISVDNAAGSVDTQGALPAPEASPIAAAAAEAATSPKNDRPEPTDAQKEAGNYKKGHVRVAGLDISIENEAGTRRNPEWPPLKHHYGYIKGTIGKDKDHVDVFMLDGAEDPNRPVFVVDQRDKGAFDEHKVILGAQSFAEARAAYAANYSDDFTQVKNGRTSRGAAGVTQMTHAEFAQWVRDPKQSVEPAAKSQYPTDADPAVKRTPSKDAGNPDYNGLKEKVHEVLDAEYEAGRIDEAEYRAVARSEPPARRDARVPGQGPRTDQDSRPEQSEGLVAATETPPTGGVSASGVDRFAGNTIFTSDKVAAAKARMKAKLGTLNSGVDPELLMDGMTVAGAYIESGVRKFADYTAAMVEDFGDAVKPYLLSFYEAVRHFPGVDREGMDDSATAAREFDALLTPADLQAEAIGQAKPEPKRRAKAKAGPERRLRDDFDTDDINGYGDSRDRETGNAIKDEFLKDARSYLKAVADELEDAGFRPTLNTKGKAEKAVSVNEGGMAGSGEVSLHMVNEAGTGVYVQVGDSALRGVVPMTTSGIAVLYRTTDGTHGHSGQNNWARTDLTAAELAATLQDLATRSPWRETHSRGATPALFRVMVNKVGKDGLTDAERAAGKAPLTDERPAEKAEKEQTAASEAPNAAEQPDRDTAEPDRVPAGGRAKRGRDATAGNADRQPVDAGLAEAGEEASGQQGLFAGAEGAGGTGASSSERSAEPDAPGAPRGDVGVRAERGAAGSVEDFDLTAEQLEKGGLVSKYRANTAAIRIVKALEAEGRVATPEERKQLARYVGWGALKGVFDPQNNQWSKQHAELKELLTADEFAAARASTRNAHFTSQEVVAPMIAGLQRMGFTRGRLLEPSVGTGNFFGMMPAALRNKAELFGVELDPLTSKIAAGLYPSARITNSGFEAYSVPGGFFDAAIGNPPFGEEPISDSDRSEYSGFSIHNYFLAKTIDKLRPGGLAMMVVSHNFLDAKDTRARKWIADRASLVAAVRLPDTAFKGNAGTEVVTDVLVFQRHDRNGLPSDDHAWVNAGKQRVENPKTGESAEHNVNEYFLANPANVLGTPTAGGTMYGPNQYTVKANGELPAQLAEWVNRLPEGIYEPIDRTRAMQSAEVPEGIKVGSYYVDDKGQIQQRGEDTAGAKTALPWTPPNSKAEGRMRGMIATRDALRAQMRLERDPAATEKDIEESRERLNKAYDAFLKEHGYLNAPVNRRLFIDDSDSDLVQALEFDYDNGISKAVADREGIDARGPSATKADIFQRRVAFPQNDMQAVYSAKDALIASLNYRGVVDPAYMAKVYDKDPDAIVKELGDLVFSTPEGGVETADEYLSGDVKTKLEEAQAAAKDNPAFARNVTALKGVIPRDKTPSEIHVSLGAHFIPSEVMTDFIEHITGASHAGAYSKGLGRWMFARTGQPDQVRNNQTWGTPHINAEGILNNTLLGRVVLVTKRERHGDKEVTVVLEAETEAAREKQNAIRNEWKSWLWRDPERGEKVLAEYNDKMNRTVPRRFDGSHLTLPGKNPGITLLKHQLDGVWRGLQSRQILLDHVVGAGKTFQIVAMLMEMRRLGIARKPVLAVPNHLTLQWRSEFTRLYPGARVLAATPDDFSKENRPKLFSKIVTGDWDAVILGHSSLKKIGLPPETEAAILKEQLDEISRGIEEIKRDRGDRNIIRDMEGIKKTLESKMKERLNAAGPRDKVLTFDELGLDALGVDELHEFKNLNYSSTMTKVPGMGNPKGSARAFDLFVKTQWLFNTYGDKAPLITATGTPVSNSLVEMYNVQRYMQYPKMKAQGLHMFDAWARAYGSVENVYEVAPSGSGFRASSRFAKFQNLSSLMGDYLAFSDVITLDDLKRQEEALGRRFPAPKVKGGRPQLVVAPRSPQVAEFMGIPKLARWEDDSAKFKLDLRHGDKFETEEKDGKVILRMMKAGDGKYPVHLGSYENMDEARAGVVEAALTPEIELDEKSVLGRFANLRELTRSTKGKVNALSLTGEANKAGLDYRLIDPAAPDFPDSKVNRAVSNILAEYKAWSKEKGTQLVFCDMSVPLSARAALAAKPMRAYVRDTDGSIIHKKATLHSREGSEELPYLVVELRGKSKDKPAEFAVYDAATGHPMQAGLSGRAAAKTWADDALASAEDRERWIQQRSKAAELDQEEIDAYNDANEIDTAETESITLQDIAGASGAGNFSIYDDMRSKLVAQGIPDREIAFIHDYNSPPAKAKLFAAVNRGDIRVLFGSTPKLGAGTNVQRLAVGLHHIDAPWKPSDLEQREGRVIRRGNALYERDPDGFAVGIYRYATEQTYDARRWQILEHKARGIEQLRTYDGSLNEIEDIDGEASNAADMKAAASGDPMILRETQLRNDVKRLENLEVAHADNVVAARRAASRASEEASKWLPRKLAAVDKMIAARQPDAAKKEDVPKGSSIDGKKFGDRKEFTQALARAVGEFASNTQLGRNPDEIEINWRGLQFTVTGNSGFSTGYVNVSSDLGDVLSFRAGELDTFSASGLVTRMNNAADRLDAMRKEIEHGIEEAKTNATRYLEEAGKPFADAENLASARRDYKAVQRILLLKGPDLQARDKKILEKGLESARAALRDAGLGDTLDEMLEAKGATPDGKFSRAPAAGRRLTLDRAQRLKQELTAQWGEDAPRVVLVESAADLQRAAGLPRSALDDPDFYRSEGYYNGRPTVWLNLAAIDGEKRLGQVLAHEALGHFGVERVVGKGEWRSISTAIDRHVKNGTGDKDLRAAIARVQETQPADVLASAEAMAQEVIAVMAENGSRNGLLQRFVAAVRRFLRRKMPSLAWSDADIRDLLHQAESFLHRGRSRQQHQAFVRANAFSRGGSDGNAVDATELDVDAAFVAGLSAKERASPAMGAFAQAMYADQGTESPFFRSWFGASKVVDGKGQPLKVYHGTNAEFDAFDPARLGKSTNHMTAALGMFFDARKSKAEHYARLATNDVPAEQQVYETYLSIENPYAMSKDEFMAIDSIDTSREVRARLVREGHDGIQLYDIGQWIAFKPEQIKRTDNRGTFNGADARMLFSRAPKDAVADIQRAIQAINQEIEGGSSPVDKVKQWLKDANPKQLKDRLRGSWLGLLTTRHLTQLGSDYFPTMTAYSEFLAEMGADRNAMQQEGEQIAESVREWAGKNRAEADRLFGVMHDATIQGADPAKDYQPLQFRYARKLYEVNRENVKEAIAAIREQMRGRPGDDKREMMQRISDLRHMLKAEPKRKARFPAMVARFNALSTEAKEHYVAMRDLYARRHDATEEALVDRINDLKLEGGEKRAQVLVNMIRQQFEAQRLQGVYFPLQRHGRYFVAAEKDDASTFQMYESQRDLERAVKALKAHGFTITAQGLKSDGTAKDAPSGTFVAEVMDMLQKAGVTEKTRDEVYQMYLQALPELSMRKHKIHRKVVPGWDPDALRAFAFNMHHGAHQLARLRYSHKLSETIEVLQAQQDARRKEEGADTARIVAGDAVLDELRKRHEWIGNPQDSRVVNLVSSFGFTYYLGLTPAAALVNLTQVPMLAFPYLASRFGGIKAMNELLRGMASTGRTLGHIDRTLTDPEEQRAHKALQEAGALDKTQVHNLAGIAEGGLAGYNPKYAKAMEIISKPFHVAEVMNREAAGMAAFRLARAAGQDFDAAVRTASETIQETMFDYTNANRARFMQSGTAKVLLMFRQYSLNMTWHMGRMLWQATKGQDPDVKRIARRNLVGVLGMSALFSGSMGLPLMSMTMGVLNAVAASGGDDDEPWDAETEFRAFLVDMLGEDIASIALDGPVNRVTGADVASRVSLSQLWFRDADRELDGRGAYYHLLEQAAGPMGGVLKNALVGKQLIDDGHLQRGVETMLPKALKDSVKAARYATEGANNLRGDALVEDLNLGQVLLQLIGFTPAEVARQYEENRSLKNYEQHVLDRRQHLMDAFAMAQRLEDQVARADALDAIRKFNAKWPELGISANTLRKSLMSRARYSAKAEGGIMLNKKIEGRIRDQVGAE